MADSTSLIEGVIIVGMMIVYRLGGPQEAYYRIRRIAYFIDYIRGPDKRYRRRLFPLSDIKKHSPAMHEYGRGMYLVPDGEAAVSASGAPMWFHSWDEARCIPQFMDTIEVTDEQTGDRYTKTEFRNKVPPEVIKAGFLGKTAADIHRAAEPPSSNKLAWYIVPMLIIITLGVLVGVYYEYNTTCSLHTLACR